MIRAWVAIFYPAIVWGVVLGLIAGALYLSSQERLNDKLLSSALSPNASMSNGDRPVVATSATGSLGGSIEPTNLPADPRVRPISRKATPDIVATIEAAAVEFNVSPTTMLRRAFCESRYNADVVGRAQEVGAFQFLPSTWMAYAPRLGYSLREIGHIEAQSRVAAYMESIGEGGQWSCR